MNWILRAKSKNFGTTFCLPLLYMKKLYKRIIPGFLILTGLWLLQLYSCDMFFMKKSRKGKEALLYVGTYTNGESKGIYKSMLLKDGTFSGVKLAAVTRNPSFLAFSADEKTLIAGNEVKNKNGAGTVETWSISNDSLIRRGNTSSGGAHPCFVAASEAGFILAANYSGGNVGLIEMASGGKSVALVDTAQHEGSNVTARQEAPHVHSVWHEPDGSGIIAVDLGTNELWFYTLDQKNKKLLTKPPYKLAMEPGAGPRHLAFHPNQKWFYVLNELDGTITQIRKKSKEEYLIGESTPTLPGDFFGENLCAHILVSADGRFVYASNRGHNSIAIFEVDQETGSLTLVAHESVHGNWPRHFAFTPDEQFLVVANQYSGNLVSFRRDSETGLLEFIDEVKVADPVCVLFHKCL